MAGVRQFDEQQALEKALELFWQKGYANTTMQELAEATGVLRGSLYNAYRDKETLFLKVFELYRERYVGKMRDALDRPGLRESLQAFFGFVIASMTTGTPSRGCLSTKTALGAEALDDPIHEVLKDLLNAIEAALYQRLSRAGKDENLALPPRQAARMIVAMTRGLVVIERVYRDEKRMRATADSLMDILLPGRRG